MLVDSVGRRECRCSNLEMKNPPADFSGRVQISASRPRPEGRGTSPVYRARAGASDCWSYFARATTKVTTLASLHLNHGLPPESTPSRKLSRHGQAIVFSHVIETHPEPLPEVFHPGFSAQPPPLCDLLHPQSVDQHVMNNG